MDAITLPQPGRRRRRYSREFKARIVETGLRPGTSVAAIARLHNISNNIVHRWIREAEQVASGASLRFLAEPAAGARWMGRPPWSSGDSRHPDDGLEDEPLMPPHALSEKQHPHISRPDDEAISIFNYDEKWKRLIWACNKTGISLKRLSA